MAAKKKKKAVKKVAKKAAPATVKVAKKKASKKPASRVGRKRSDDASALGSPALFHLVGRAITDPVFATALLANPQMVVTEFELDPKTREEVLQLLSKPALVANSILELRGRIGRPSKEAI